jgi:Domain of unknown function (DUF4845)
MKKSMTNTRSNQRGMTMISLMVLLIFFVFVAVMLMNVLPVYMTDSTVDTVMKGLESDDAAKRTSAKSLRGLVHKRLTMNSIYSIKPEYIKIKKGRGENIVTIEYEPRGTLVGSLDYIVTFKHEARIKTK